MSSMGCTNNKGVIEEEEEVSEVGESGRGKRFQLTPFEIYSASVCNLTFFYLFDSDISVEFMERRMGSVLKELPILSSVMKLEEKSDTGDMYFFECVSPSNITISKKDVPESLFSSYIENESNDYTLSFEEGEEFLKYLDICDVDAPTQRPKVDVPLMKITLMYNAKVNKSVIGFCINHGLVDAHSGCFLFHHILTGKRKCEKNYDCIRPKCLLGKNQNTKKESDYPKNEDPWLLQHTKIYHPFTDVPQKDIGVGLSSDCVQKIIHFTPERIKELKEIVNKKNEKNLRFSSHDCVAAVMWMLYGAISTTVETDVIPLNLVMNMRNRAKGVGGDEYFGNAVIIPNMDLTREDLFKNMTFEDIVFKVREFVTKSSTDIENGAKITELVHNCLERYREKLIGFHRKRMLILNDWRLFDRLDNDLVDEEGRRRKCERMIMWPKESHAMVYTNMCFSNLHADGGIIVKICLDRSDYDKMKKFDVTSVGDVRKIKELY